MNDIIWVVELMRMEDSGTLGFLSGGKLSNVWGWEYRGCELQAKQWKQRSNAAKWAAIGNKMHEKQGFPTRYVCRPMSKKAMEWLSD